MSDLNSTQISVSQWQAEGDFFRYQRADKRYAIFYRDSKRMTADHNEMKPVLLLIHGFPTASIDWHWLWADLSRSFRLVTLDMVGFGLSDKPKHYAYSIHDQADIYQALLNALGIHHYHILAHDYGDTVAQELLAREQVGKRESALTDQHEDRSQILSTILLNGGLFPETHRPVLMQKLLASPIGAMLIKLYSFKKFKHTFATICAQTISDHELNIYWQLLQHNNGVAAMPKLIRYMEERKIHRQRWVGALENTACPMRLIDGLADPISGAHMVERYKQLIKNPDVVELQGIGHYPQVEAPQQVLNAAFDFWIMHKVVSRR